MPPPPPNHQKILLQQLLIYYSIHAVGDEALTRFIRKDERIRNIRTSS